MRVCAVAKEICEFERRIINLHGTPSQNLGHFRFLRCLFHLLFRAVIRIRVADTFALVEEISKRHVFGQRQVKEPGIDDTSALTRTLFLHAFGSSHVKAFVDVELKHFFRLLVLRVFQEAVDGGALVFYREQNVFFTKERTTISRSVYFAELLCASDRVGFFARVGGGLGKRL